MTSSASHSPPPPAALTDQAIPEPAPAPQTADAAPSERSAEAVAASMQKVRIVPPKGWQALDLKELWRYRELTWFLALRDIKVRYKQTALGVVWAVIQPLLQTFIFTLFFHKVAGIQGPGGVPYEIWVFCAMIPWQLFETSLTNAGNSLVGSQNLISKVYFPRLSIPISTIIAAVVDFLIAFGLLIIVMAAYGRMPGLPVLLLPVFVMLAVVAALAVGLWLSALNVQYRDVRYVIPFLARIWFFATPILFPVSKVNEHFGKTGEVLFALNPMAGVIEGFRWALLGTPAPSPLLLTVSTAATFILLVGGLYYFKRMEQTFADIV